MNYAWANPLTGIREQTEQSTPERMLAEAEWRVWQELQEIRGVTLVSQEECQIWAQTPIGNVTVSGPGIDVEKANAAPKNSQFAWPDPESGERIVTPLFSEKSAKLTEQLRQMQARGEHVGEGGVIIYATWPECVIRRSDPQPERWEQDGEYRDGEPSYAAPDSYSDGSSDFESQKAKLGAIVDLDDSTVLAKITAWALLDIAGSLRMIRSSGAEFSEEAAKAYIDVSPRPPVGIRKLSDEFEED